MATVFLPNAGKTEVRSPEYRWYACTAGSSWFTQKTSWSCAISNENEALALSDTPGHCAIRIRNTIPKLVDPLILHSKLHPRVHVE